MILNVVEGEKMSLSRDSVKKCTVLSEAALDAAKSKEKKCHYPQVG